MTKKEILLIVLLLLVTLLISCVLIVRARNVDLLYKSYNVLSILEGKYV